MEIEHDFVATEQEDSSLNDLGGSNAFDVAIFIRLPYAASRRTSKTSSSNSASLNRLSTRQVGS